MSAETSESQKGGISKVKLALGAASLFLFIVGIKRTFRTDESPTGVRLRDELPEDELDPGQAPDERSRRR